MIKSVKLEKEFDVPSFIEKVMSGNTYTSYGDNNDTPKLLYGLYSNSSILQSIINGTTDYVIGEKFIIDKMNSKDVKKIVLDYLIFGGFCVQIYYKKGVITKVEWRDFIKCRKNQEETEVYYSNQWGKYKSKSIVFPMWTPEFNDGTCMFYYKGSITRGIYPVPIWNGALKSVVISTEISNFHFNNILNGFNSNFIINMNNGTPDKETQDIIEQQIRDTFCGSDNAGKFMISWSDDAEHAPTVERIASDDYDTKYQSLAEFVRNDIFTAFRATPNLFGLPTETTGFSSQEYQDSFALYNKTVVQPIVKEITELFNEMGLAVVNEPFKISFDTVENQEVNNI